MNSTQMACLQKLINTLKECEDVGVTFSYASLLINVENEQSYYLEYLSAQKIFEILDFIDGCGDVELVETPKSSQFGYDLKPNHEVM